MSTDLTAHGIVALVRDPRGKFLLLQEAREGITKGLWAPPHGRCRSIDHSEEESVVREMREETGLSAKPTRKLLTQSADTKIKTVSFWLVETNSPTVSLNHESSRYGWFTIDEALTLPLFPGTKSFFETVKRNNVVLD